MPYSPKKNFIKKKKTTNTLKINQCKSIISKGKQSNLDFFFFSI